MEQAVVNYGDIAHCGAIRVYETCKEGSELICGVCGSPYYTLYPDTQEAKAETSDKIEHPHHYTNGIECWDYITSHQLNYCAGNVVKYVTRYRFKNGLEDLKKARQYLDKLIETEYPDGK